MDSRYYFVIAVCLYGVASFLHRIAAIKIGVTNIQIFSAVISLISLPVILSLLKTDSVKFYGSGFAFAIVASCLAVTGNIFMITGNIRSSSPGSLGMVISLYPTISLILAVIFLHEQITIQKAIATCLIILGALLLMIK
jgi:drug/metabolite transporter (DMT)-like permease